MARNVEFYQAKRTDIVVQDIQCELRYRVFEDYPSVLSATREYIMGTRKGESLTVQETSLPIKRLVQDGREKYIAIDRELENMLYVTCFQERETKLVNALGAAQEEAFSWQQKYVVFSELPWYLRVWRALLSRNCYG
jgi:hypothetical protein